MSNGIKKIVERRKRNDEKIYRQILDQMKQMTPRTGMTVPALAVNYNLQWYTENDLFFMGIMKECKEILYGSAIA